MCVAYQDVLEVLRLKNECKVIESRNQEEQRKVKVINNDMNNDNHYHNTNTTILKHYQHATMTW